MPHVSSSRPAAVALAAVLAVGLGACGGAEAGPAQSGARPQAPVPTPATSAATGSAPAPTPATSATTGSAPAALTANAVAANRIVGEGTADLRRRLASLKGHPVVVNQWASWCGPCRFELAFFAAAVKRHRAAVAFVGLNFMDSRDAAEGFAADTLPGFPSVFDPDGSATRSLGTVRGAPTTFFLGTDGRVAHTKYGGYPDAAALESDIRRYALKAPS